MEIYGISSKIPSFFMKKKRHWFMLDVDDSSLSNYAHTFEFCMKLLDYPKDYVQYHSPHGFHLIIFEPLRFSDLYDMLKIIPACDPSWRNIGYQRGYWFLHTWDYVQSPKFPLTYMKIKVTIKGYEEKVNAWLNTKHQPI